MLLVVTWRFRYWRSRQLDFKNSSGVRLAPAHHKLCLSSELLPDLSNRWGLWRACMSSHQPYVRALPWKGWFPRSSLLGMVFTTSLLCVKRHASFTEGACSRACIMWVISCGALICIVQCCDLYIMRAGCGWGSPCMSAGSFHMMHEVFSGVHLLGQAALIALSRFYARVICYLYLIAT